MGLEYGRPADPTPFHIRSCSFEVIVQVILIVGFPNDINLRNLFNSQKHCKCYILLRFVQTRVPLKGTHRSYDVYSYQQQAVTNLEPGPTSRNRNGRQLIA